MNILQYNELDYSKVRKQFKKVVNMLKNDDFYSAEVKKLTNTPYYRAKLDYTNRLLFKFVRYYNKNYALLLEVIHNHEYEKSRFLAGACINESKINTIHDINNNEVEPIIYLNNNINTFHVLDKIISFDDTQHEIFECNLPLVVIGSAGSGKTVLTLEKMKNSVGDILYVTHSPYLVENSRNLYYGNQYINDDQNIDFLSYQELIETIEVPKGREIDSRIFAKWLSKYYNNKLSKDSNKLYEEFKGVLTGSIIDKKYLLYDDYINLGVKQSIFAPEERAQVYKLFENYLEFLHNENLYDSNMVSYEYLRHCQPKYDYIIVDEIQDLTNIQLYLILQMLRNKDQFILSGDSNQIVHPNFFSWSKIKTMFYSKQVASEKHEIRRVLYKNYRNSPEITAVANNILRIKNKRFGSIDKESNYLVDSCSKNPGQLLYLQNTKNICQELNDKTNKSTRFAIIVLNNEQKIQAQQYFKTPLIFSIHEVKGLEYENIILYNFITSEQKRFNEISQGVTEKDLESDLSYARVKDKADRSLEIYKFYINALYVAVTRAINTLYIVEDCRKHNLLAILGLESSQITIDGLDYNESSVTEWRQEAHKLEQQGKQHQAEEIRKSILAQKQTPWEPINKERIEMLKIKALNKDTNKNDKLLLFEYAVVYQQEHIIEALKDLDFKPAKNPNKARGIIEKKYFLFYLSQNISTVKNNLNTYGVDFRNIFNQTALMTASMLGNIFLVKYLIENGANIGLVDNAGKDALQIALLQAYTDNKYANIKLEHIYKLLTPSSISIQVDGKLIKIDNHTMEFFLLNLIIAIFSRRFFDNFLPGFATADFIEQFKHFPSNVLLERRKRRNYISSILSKNEIHRVGPYNRKLFLRAMHGRYIINPKLEIKVSDSWMRIYTLLGLDDVNITDFVEKL